MDNSNRLNLGGKYFTDNELKRAGFRKLGKNVKIHNRSSIYGVENISIGNNVRIDDFVVIIATGNLEIESYVQVCNFCFLGAKHGITLGDFTTLAPGVKIFTSSDDYSGEKLTNPTVSNRFTGGDSGPVVIKKYTIIGAGSIILPNCIIEEGVSIGALSLVKRSLSSWGIYAGIPIRRLKNRKKELLKLELQLKREVGRVK